MIDKHESPVVMISPGEMNFIFRARMLWRDLATWITIYLVSYYGGFSNEAAVRDKLYRLPLEYGDFLKLVFGDVPTEQSINLLSRYVIALENLFQAQKSGDVNAINAYTRQLYQITDQMAEYFAQINPFWQKDVWVSLLYNFNSMLIEDSMALLANDYVKNVEVYERLLSYSSVIGDYFSEGIIKYLNRG